MMVDRLRRLALALVDAAAWIVPAGERRRWQAQWHADIWHRCDVLARTGLTSTPTTFALLARVSGAIRHAAWLRCHRRGGFMLWPDIRQAFRALGGRPAFTTVAVLTLALGIGANAVIFSWIDTTLLNTLPGVRDRGSLAAVFVTSPQRENLSLSYPNFVEVRNAGVPGLADVAVYATGSLSWRTEQGAERVWAQILSGNMFDLLGIHPALGRLIGPEDDRVPGQHPVAVVSHTFWLRRLQARTDVVGSTLVLNEHAFTIIGVAPAGFHGALPLMAMEVFLPVAMQQAFVPGNRLQDRRSGWLRALVRLDPGTSRADLQSGLDVAAARLASAYPDANEGRGLRVFPLWRQPEGGAAALLPVMSVLGALVATLLALVCANMAGLLLARASGRQRELAVRRAVGASSWQVARLVMAESLVVASVAGLLALVAARWSGDLLRAFIPPVPLPIVIDAGVNLRVWLFSTAVSLGAGVLLGLLPSLHASRGDLVAPLKEATVAGASGRSRRGRVRQGLIVIQVAMSLVLLVSGGLFLRTLDTARAVDPGFAARRGLVGGIAIGGAGYDEVRGQQMYDALRREVAALPGVEGVALAQSLPLTVYGSSDRSVAIEGYTPAANEEMSVFYASASEGLFATIQMPMLEGRDFTARDRHDAPPVVVINQTMARRYWPGRSALGGQVKIGDAWAEVVGVVKDAKYSSLTEAPRPYMYRPLQQAYRPTMQLVIRTAGDPDQALAAVRAAILRVDAGLPYFDVQTFEQHRAFSFFLFEMAATVLGLFGAVAMFLAALGLYGVVAYSVGERTREIGVRMSLGATTGDVRQMVLGQGLRLVVVGIGIGLAVAIGVTPLFARQLLGVGPLDPLSFAGTTGLLLATTALACYLPARRAARLDPVRALREE